jgi:hypothetical protein
MPLSPAPPTKSDGQQALEYARDLLAVLFFWW